jgi:hypothetical protein
MTAGREEYGKRIRMRRRSLVERLVDRADRLDYTDIRLARGARGVDILAAQVVVVPYPKHPMQLHGDNCTRCWRKWLMCVS